MTNDVKIPDRTISLDLLLDALQKMTEWQEVADASGLNHYNTDGATFNEGGLLNAVGILLNLLRMIVDAMIRIKDEVERVKPK